MSGTGSRRSVVLAILGAVVVLGVGGFVWVRGVVTRLVDEGRVVLEAGRTAGRTLSAVACVDTVFARHKQETSLSLRVQLDERLFFDGCLKTSEPSPELCVDVPPEGAFARAARWALEQCRARGLRDPNCPNLLVPLQEYCGRRAGDSS